jgi:pimeloyl-ACP methyl ester carboxylesterase
MVENGQETLLFDYAACLDFDVRGRLADVRVPVLVVTGDGDALTPLSLAQELAAGLPEAVAVVLPDAGHWPMKERPATVDLLIAGFLARLELTGA